MSGMIPQKRELPPAQDEELDEALDTADDDGVLWIRGGGLGFSCFLLAEVDRSLLVKCCENVTFEGDLNEDCR